MSVRAGTLVPVSVYEEYGRAGTLCVCEGRYSIWEGRYSMCERVYERAGTLCVSVRAGTLVPVSVFEEYGRAGTLCVRGIYVS